MKDEDHHTAASKPFVLVIFGLPGTGKSTIAMTLSNKLGIPFYNTDRIRDELGLRNNYTEEIKDYIYGVMLAKAKTSLNDGSPVIFDGTFHKRDKRKKVIALAERKKVPVFFIECVADEDAIRKRTSQKRKYSQADFDVYKMVKAEYEPPVNVDMTLFTDRESVDLIISRIIDLLKRRELLLKDNQDG